MQDFLPLLASIDLLNKGLVLDLPNKAGKLAQPPGECVDFAATLARIPCSGRAPPSQLHATLAVRFAPPSVLGALESRRNAYADE